ncbi:si:dkey-100n23.5 isoform X3 [Pungitius pungitius]|uniref:si:dkey-100n23.5 isoform X3 n=1 Tax=Pungitius pungitius TaxID=134920 RepID=UPI002E14F2CF
MLKHPKHIYLKMESQNPTSTNNDSRCVFFNTVSEDYQCVLILRVKRATGTFSLVGCVFMLFVIWLLRRYHSLAQKMILSLTVAAFFDSVAYVMGDSHPEGALCDFQACWLTYFDWSALAWVCLITLNLYLNLVVPSDGVGASSGHGLLAPAKGLLRPRRSLVMVCASVQPHLLDDLLLRPDNLRGHRKDAVMVGNLQPRERETKAVLGGGDQAVEVVSFRLPAGVHLPPRQQAPQCLLPTGSVFPAHPVARPVGTAPWLGQCVCLRPGSGRVEPSEPHWHAAGSAVAAV